MDQIKKYLDNALSSKEFIELYNQITAKHELLKSFNTPLELMKFLHDFKQKRYQANDAVLGILIKEYQSRGRSHLVFNYLLEILSPGLEAVFYRFRTRMREDAAFDEHDLRSQIRLSLLDVLNTYNLESKPAGIAVTIMNRIRSRLVFLRGKIRRQQESISAYIKELELAAPQIASSHMEYEESLKSVKEKLTALVKRKIIAKKDSFIILATRVYDKSLKELAKEQGLSYNGLRKRRQRAEEKIRKFLSQ